MCVLWISEPHCGVIRQSGAHQSIRQWSYLQNQFQYHTGKNIRLVLIRMMKIILFQGTNALRLNSSEARIRKWQQFYGASSAEASTSTISTINEVDHNSNSRSSIIAHSARKKVVVSG